MSAETDRARGGWYAAQAVQTRPITYVDVNQVMAGSVLEALASSANLGSWGDNDLTLIECRNLIERLKDLIADVRQHPEETELFVEAADALRNLQALPAGTYINLEL